MPSPDRSRGLFAAHSPDAVDGRGLAGAPEPASRRRGLAGIASSVLGDRMVDVQAVGDAAGPASAPSVRVATQLREVCDAQVILLHHRSAGDELPRLDHVAVGPSGVWVIHSRQPSGRVEMREPMFGRAKLTIGGRERMDLLQALDAQRAAVAATLAGGHPSVVVRSALCFVDTPAPLLRTLYLGSYLFFGASALAQHLNSEGPLASDAVRAVGTVLETGFPPA